MPPVSGQVNQLINLSYTAMRVAGTTDRRRLRLREAGVVAEAWGGGNSDRKRSNGDEVQVCFLATTHQHLHLFVSGKHLCYDLLA